MRFVIKQRQLETKGVTFTALDDFDIYDANNQIVYTVKDRLPFIRWLDIRDADGNKVGSVWNFWHTYYWFQQGHLCGSMWPKATPFKTSFALKCRGWTIDVNDDDNQWSGMVYNSFGEEIAQISKDVFDNVDTYISVGCDPNDVVPLLMMALSLYTIFRDYQMSDMGSV